MRYIFERGSFSPYTHLYQLYLQYLPNYLNEIEYDMLYDGYSLMLQDLYGENCIKKQ